MCNLLKISIPLLLVILKLRFSTSSNFTIKNLGVICGLLDANVITSPPQQCTALAIHSNDINNLLEAANKMKGNLPLVIIMDHMVFSSISEIDDEDMNDVLGNYVNIDFDFLVIDKTYEAVDVHGGSAEERFSQEIGSFLDKARKYLPGKGLGLVIRHDIKPLKNKVDLLTLNDHLDFFILESTEYRNCKHHNHQRDMNVLATKDDIIGTFEELKKAGLTLDKIIYTIDLKIESRKRRKHVTAESMDYSYLCAHKLSIHRKYCFNSIQVLFDKARLRISEGAAGIYITGIQYDDFNGTCECKTQNDEDPTFRGLKTIAGASQENVNDVGFYDCKEGKYPVIK